MGWSEGQDKECRCSLVYDCFLGELGNGGSCMVDACKAVGLPEPEYDTDGGFVWITFMRPNSVTNSITNSVTNSDTNLDTYIRECR